MFEVCVSEGKTKVAWILPSASKLERKFKFAKANSNASSSLLGDLTL